MEFSSQEKMEIQKLLQEQDAELRLIRMKQYLVSRNSSLSYDGIDYTHVATQIIREHESKRPRHTRR
jgi:hypothetical protein